MTRHFGSKQPSRAAQLADFKRLICSARTLESLPDRKSLAAMYRLDEKTVEYEIGAERRKRTE